MNKEEERLRAQVEQVANVRGHRGHQPPPLTSHWAVPTAPADPPADTSDAHSVKVEEVAAGPAPCTAAVVPAGETFAIAGVEGTALTLPDGRDAWVANGLSPGDASLVDDVFGAAADPTAWDWFANITDRDRAYLLAPRSVPEPCPWCGRRLKHSPQCVSLCDEWQVAMPLGKYRGRPVRDCPADYLGWLASSGVEIASDVREEIQRVLAAAKAKKATAVFRPVGPVKRTEVAA